MCILTCSGGSRISLKGVYLLILPDYLLFFADLRKILHENKMILSQRGFEQPPRTSSGSATDLWTFLLCHTFQMHKCISLLFSDISKYKTMDQN